MRLNYWRRSNLALGKGEMSARRGHELDNLAIRSQKQVGDMLGLTRQRVQQIERMALLKLRKLLQHEREMLE